MSNLKKISYIIIGGFLLTFLTPGLAYTPCDYSCNFKNHLPSNLDKIQVYPKTDTIKEYVLTEAYKRGINPDAIECLVTEESKWKNVISDANTNGTVDVGLFQINDVHDLSISFRLDYRKSTEWSLNKITKEGNANAWYGFNKCNEKLFLKF